MINIAITMTATRRRDILYKTLKSFQEYFLGPYTNIRYKYVVNVDPVGPSTIEEIKVMLAELVPYTLDITCPDTASFPRAFRRVWTKVLETNADLVFHLEDDWELLRHISLPDMLYTFLSYPDLAILRLSAFRSGPTSMKIWNRWTEYNGDFFQISDAERGLLGFAGHPSLIRREFVELATKVLDGKSNPEKQLKGRNPVLKPYFGSHIFGVYNTPDSPALIRDLGRKWMIKNGYRKVGSKAHFTNWEKQEGV